MPRDYGLYLDDIAEAIKKVLKYTAIWTSTISNRTREQWMPSSEILR